MAKTTFQFPQTTETRTAVPSPLSVELQR